MNTSIKLYKISQKFIKDPKEASNFVEQIEATVTAKMDKRFDYLATKTDLSHLKVLLLDVIYAQKEDLMTVINAQKVDFS